MKITFLGTGTSMGVPVIGCKCAVCLSKNEKDKRLRTSALIESNGETFLIDTTPDFREQMLKYDVNKLSAILFTHAHRDHVAGLDDVRAYNFILKQDVYAYGSNITLQGIEKMFPYIFEENKYPGVPEVNFIEIENKPFEVAKHTFTPIQVMHYKLPVQGFRLGDLTYITDANYISDAEKEKIRGSKVLVLNALRKEKHISHFTLQEAIDLVNELEIETAFFTHISHQLGKHADITAELPPNIHLAYDGLVVDI